MPWTLKQILRDADGKPIPQIWDAVAGDFVPAEGKVTESALPTGAATATKQDTLIAEIVNIKAAVVEEGVPL